MLCLLAFASVDAWKLLLPSAKNMKINGYHQFSRINRGTPEFGAVSQMFHVLPHRNQVVDLQTNTDTT
jgi:hypothetical protein